jgi:hypothetical protein
VFGRSAPDLLSLSRRERQRLSPRLGLSCDAIPQVLNELDALGKGEMQKVGELDGIHTLNVVAAERSGKQAGTTPNAQRKWRVAAHRHLKRAEFMARPASPETR